MGSRTYPYTLHTNDEASCTLVYVNQGCMYVALQPLLLHPGPQQYDKPHVVEINDDVDMSIYTRSFNSSAYKRMDIWARTDQIKDIQHPLNDNDA